MVCCSLPFLLQTFQCHYWCIWFYIWIQHTRGVSEQIDLLEGKLQQAVNENAKLKVKQTEDSKLWQGLDSKLSSTKTLCDQLTETLQQLASQTEQGKLWWHLLCPTVVQIWLVTGETIHLQLRKIRSFLRRCLGRIPKIWTNSTACCVIYQQNWRMRNKR